MSRRDFIKHSVAATASVMLVTNPSRLSAAEEKSVPTKALNVLCVGGHPDDPESGCAGTLARYAEAGHNVAIIYLTRGERGIPGKSLDEAAEIRTAEAEAACKIMGARAVFAGQIDGATEITRERVNDMTKLLSAEKPDLIFTHWPIDTHMDHQVASQLAYRAYLSLSPRPQMYYFEVNLGSQSQGFTPNVYVDITPVLEKKKNALFAHKSQGGEGIWKEHHQLMASFRGREAGVSAAEAFVHLNRDSKTSKLPGL